MNEKDSKRLQAIEVAVSDIQKTVNVLFWCTAAVTGNITGLLLVLIFR